MRSTKYLVADSEQYVAERAAESTLSGVVPIRT